MIYGTCPVRIHDDQTDRIGIRTLVLAKLWQASRDGLTLDDLDSEAPATPEAPSGMEFIGRNRRPMSGGLREFWTYTGAHSNGKDVVFKGYGKSPDYHFEPGFAQVSLLKHKKIARLLEQFGGEVRDSEIVWRPTIAGFGSTSGLGLKADDTGGGRVTSLGLGASQQDAGDNGKTNPMFGEQDFLRHEGTYSYRYAALNLNGLNQGLKIVKPGNLPGYAPSYGDRDYLVGPQAFQRHGPVYAITLEAWLSGEGGWNRHIYGGSIG